MLLDINDVRAELERLARETEEEFAGRRNRKTLHYGMLAGYHKVEIMLCKLEAEEYRNQGLEHIRSMREE
jgi:hypothetical protein|nr:MAG TPA_asm: Protein of unknown function (DUF2787) [Bacteriophage sp.]